MFVNICLNHEKWKLKSNHYNYNVDWNVCIHFFFKNLNANKKYHYYSFSIMRRYFLRFLKCSQVQRIHMCIGCMHFKYRNLKTQVFSEHEQAQTPPKSFSSISEVSMTFRSKVLSRTSSSLENPICLAILANFTTSGRVFLTEMVKRHIYGPRPFI